LNVTGAKITIGRSIAAILGISVGAIICFFGYKLFRPSIFLCGFFVGGIIVGGVAKAAFKNQEYVTTATWIAFAIGGIIFGALVLSLYNVGIFLIGAAAGILIAFVLNTFFGHKLYPSDPAVVLIVMSVVLGILGGALAMKIERTVLVISTSLIGAEMCVCGVGYFAGDYPSILDLKHVAHQDINGEWIYSIPIAWWGYFVGSIVLFIFGTFVQFKKTSKGVNKSVNKCQTKAISSSKHYNDVQTPQRGNPVSYV
jgi:hypothetical protein